MQAVLRDENGVRQVVERRHANSDQLLAGMFRTERPQQHRNGLTVRLRQVFRERAGDVPSAIDQFERVQAVARLLDEACRRESRMNPDDIASQTPHQYRREKVLQQRMVPLRADLAAATQRRARCGLRVMLRGDARGSRTKHLALTGDFLTGVLTVGGRMLDFCIHLGTGKNRQP
jgi:hypothetical protein